MPTTINKSTAVLASAVSMGAGAYTSDSPYTTTSVDATTKLGVRLCAQITNGATGPTIAASLRLMGSPDGTTWSSENIEFITQTGNAVKTAYKVERGITARYFRWEAYGNTGQAVTLDAWVENADSVG